MSKRESSPLMNRPVARVQKPCCKRADLTQVPLDRPVEPFRNVVSIPFDQLDPQIIDAAPIHAYLRTQFDGRYSRQCLIQRLIEMIDQESWHALKGVRQFRAIHSANCVLIEALLDVLDERESLVAA